MAVTASKAVAALSSGTVKEIYVLQTYDSRKNPLAGRMMLIIDN